MTDDTWTHPTLSREQFHARLDELSMEATIAEAKYAANGQAIPTWWLSFCDPERPQGTQFLGACIVQAATEVAAVHVTHQLGINPGGSVAIVGPLPTEDFSDEYKAEWCNRLLTKHEAENMPGPDEE